MTEFRNSRKYQLAKLAKSAPYICDECGDLRQVSKEIDNPRCSVCGAEGIESFMRMVLPGPYIRFDSHVSNFEKFVLEVRDEVAIVRVAYQLNAGKLDPTIVCDILDFFGYVDYEGQRVLRYTKTDMDALSKRIRSFNPKHRQGVASLFGGLS